MLLVRHGKLPIHPLVNRTEYIDFSSSNALSIIENTYNKWANDYSREVQNYECPPIEYYCGNCHDNLNEGLRNPGQPMPSFLKQLGRDLSEIILNAPRTPCDIIVYRALGKDVVEKYINHCKNGIEITDPAFMSTSLKYECLLQGEFKQCDSVLKLYVPQGTPAIYIDIIPSTNPMLGERDEQELLIHPNATIQVIGYPYKKSGRLFLECAIKHNNGYEDLML